jgi:hypothetical protein
MALRSGSIRADGGSVVARARDFCLRMRAPFGALKMRGCGIFVNEMDF